MSVPVQFLGIDPGATTGFALLRAWPYTDLNLVVQCNHLAARVVLDGLLTYDEGCPTVIAVERFVVGRRSARSSTAKAGEITRNLIGAIQEAADRSSTPTTVVMRAAAAVKPWAQDRLGPSGLLAATTGMTHARDACMHALFAACHDGGLPDPLSRKATR